jgi:hypothetical protein
MLRIFYALVIFFAVERFCHFQTAGFRLDKIHSAFVFHPSYPPPAESETQIKELLAQPFTFLGSGVQFYAFLGEDKKTVLKVFKHYHNMPIKGIAKSFPLPDFLEKKRSQLIQRREQRLNSIFSSCEIAYHQLKNESGMITLHLLPSEHLHQKISIFDKLGIRHEIDADTTAFVIQKKADLLVPTFKELLKKKDQAGVKAHLSSLIQLIKERGEKGISNHDLRIERNIGFSEGKAIEIDVGSFKPRQKTAAEQLKKSTKKELFKLKQWVKKECPEFVDYVEKEIKNSA